MLLHNVDVADPGFYAESSDHPPQVSLVYLGGKYFRLETPFRFIDPVNLESWRIRAQTRDERTDLASCPPWLWGLTASYGRQLYPALLHDQRTAEARALYRAGRRTEGYQERRRADLQFRRALMIQNVPLLRAGMFWAAVTLQRQFRFGKPLLGLFFVVQLLVSAVAFWGMVVAALPLIRGVVTWLVDGVTAADDVPKASLGSYQAYLHEPFPWAMIFLAAVLGLSMLQGKDYLAAVAGSLCVPIAGVALIVGVLASVLLWLADVPYLLVRTVHDVGSGRKARPWPGPVPFRHQ
jgi:hypothetical protein